MKWKVIALVVVLIAALICVTRWIGGRKMPLADKLPAGAYLYLGLNGGDEVARDIIGSVFWRELAATDGAKLMRKAFPEWSPAIRNFEGRADLIGRETAVAAYGKGSPYEGAVIFAVSPRQSGEKLKGTVMPARTKSKDFSHGGVAISTFVVPGAWKLQGAFASEGDFAFYAFGGTRAGDLVKAAVELAREKDGNSLAGDRRLLTALGVPRRDLGSCLGCVYLDIPSFRAEAGALYSLWRRVSGRVPRLAGLGGLFGWELPSEGELGGYFYRNRGIAADIRFRSPEGAAAIMGEPGRIETLNLVPGEIIGFAAFRPGNLGAAPLSFLEERWGISVKRDILPWLGDEACVYLSDVDSRGLLPIPIFGAVARVKDAARAEKWRAGIAARLTQTAAPGEPWDFMRPRIEAVDYKGVRIETLLYPIPLFSPGSALMDNFLVFGSDSSLVRKAIDARTGAGVSIARDGLFREMRAFVPPDVSGIRYMDFSRAIEAAEGLAGWLLRVERIRMAGEEDTERVAEIDRISRDLPKVARCLKVFRAAIAASVPKGRTREEIFVVRIEDIGR